MSLLLRKLSGLETLLDDAFLMINDGKEHYDFQKQQKEDSRLERTNQKVLCLVSARMASVTLRISEVS